MKARDACHYDYDEEECHDYFARTSVCLSGWLSGCMYACMYVCMSV